MSVLVPRTVVVDSDYCKDSLCPHLLSSFLLYQLESWFMFVYVGVVVGRECETVLPFLSHPLSSISPSTSTCLFHPLNFLLPSVSSSFSHLLPPPLLVLHIVLHLHPLSTSYLLLVSSSLLHLTLPFILLVSGPES